MIVYSYTVVNPRAMVVESLHALITYGAMPRTRSPQDFTVWTHFAWMHILEKVYELMLSLKIAWVSP